MIEVTDNPLGYWDRQFYAVGTELLKVASDMTPAYNLTGMLYATEHKGKPWILLSVPNALVRGIFDAMSEPGVELPLSDGRLNAHVSVVRPDEIELLGGIEAFRNDRGKTFRYSLGRLCEVVPEHMDGIAKVFAVRIHSPELQALRRSHGLSSLPNDGKYDFHITTSWVRRGILGRNDKSKETAAA